MTDKKKQPRKASESPQSDKNTEATEKLRADRLAVEIGDRISKARNGLGISQQAVHVRSKMLDPDGLGVSRASLSLYEIGTNKPGAREIRLLCEVLHVSPNWLLYGSESPARALQPTTLFLAGDDLDIAVRLAFAMLALNSSDRDSLANIVFSMVSGKLGDMQLSGLMAMANLMREDILKKILECVGEDSKKLPISELMKKFAKEISEGISTNYGSLRPNLTEEEIDEGKEFGPPREL